MRWWWVAEAPCLGKNIIRVPQVRISGPGVAVHCPLFPVLTSLGFHPSAAPVPAPSAAPASRAFPVPAAWESASAHPPSFSSGTVSNTPATPPPAATSPAHSISVAPPLAAAPWPFQASAPALSRASAPALLPYPPPSPPESLPAATARTPDRTPAPRQPAAASAA